MKIDLHTNIGAFPASDRKGSQKQWASVDDIVEHLVKFNITHHMCLYPYDGYHYMEELQARLPDVVHWGVQCVMHHEPDDTVPTDHLELDCNNSDRPLSKGIKIASHRGWWRDTVLTDPYSGTDYSDVKFMKRILDRVPAGSLVSMHTQGSSSPTNTSTPISVANLAARYPDLKFIINHAGDYGTRMGTAKPGATRLVEDTKKAMPNLLRHAQSRGVIANAVELAEWFHNIFLDSSNFMIHKADILARTDQWCIGTDIPFADPQFYDYDKELADYLKIIDPSLIERCYSNTLNYINSDINTLLKAAADSKDRYYQSLRKSDENQVV